MTGGASPPSGILPPGIFAGRNYAVLGLARTGMASIRALCDAGARVLAWDRDPEARRLAEQIAGDCRGLLRVAEIDRFSVAGFDGIVVSPGVPLNRHPITEVYTFRTVV